MKKTLFKLSGISVLLTVLISGCSKEPLTEGSPLEPDQTNAANIGILSAGDGIYDVLGHGYNVAGEFADASAAYGKVIDVERFELEQDERFLKENARIQVYSEDYGVNAYEYSKMISQKTSATLGFKLFSATISNSFNSTTAFDGKYIYGSYNLSVSHKRFRLMATADFLQSYLTSAFQQDLQSYTPQQLVQIYGTHVLTGISTGASLKVMFQSETSNSDRELAARAGIKGGVSTIFDVSMDDSVNVNQASNNFSRKIYYRTKGGDPTKQLIGNVNLDQSTPQISITNWLNSSTPQNSVLVDIDQDGLVILYDLISDPAKKAAVKLYIDQYLIDNQVDLIENTVPIYSYFSPQGNDHYISTDPDIADRDSYWVKENLAFRAFNYQAPGTVPVYSYRSINGNDHWSAVGDESVVNNPVTWWVLLGIDFYAYDAPGPNRIAVYNYNNSNSTDNYLTTDAYLAQKDSYWKYQGISFYVPE